MGRPKRTRSKLHSAIPLIDPLVKHLPIGYCLGSLVVDAKRRPVDISYLFLNNAFEAVTGRRSKELLGTKASLVDPNVTGDVIKRCAAVVKTGRPATFVYRTAKNARTLLAEVHRPSRGRFAIILRDEPDLALRRALEESERELREAQEIALLGRWELNHTTTALSWSTTIFQMFEIDRKAFNVSYEAFLDVIHPEDRDLVHEAFTRSLQNKTPYEIEHRLLMPDGRIKWVVEKCRTEYDTVGTPIRSIGIVQDITRRKQAEDQLHSSERTAQAAFAAVPESICVLDEHGKIIFANDAWHEFARANSGNSPRDFIGDNYVEICLNAHGPHCS